MSQPVGIIAKINISEDNLKKFLRRGAVAVMAQQIFDTINEDRGDVFVFKYSKRENILYSFSCFNYGNEDFLLTHPVLEMFKNITQYLDDDSKGYLIATCDSLNCFPNDFAYCAIIQDKKWEQKTLTEEEIKSYWKDADKHFFKKADQGMEYLLGRVVHKSVVRKVKQFQEKQRVKNLKENLHAPTPENPVQFFKGYFYNGQQFYCCSKHDCSMTVFNDIDLQQLRQTDYGLCDDKGVIVGDKYIKTDPSKFTRWSKNEIIFYSSAESVYNEDLEPYPNSDGASYKMITYRFGEDKNCIYLYGEQFLKYDIGSYKISDFNGITILYSKTKIYVGMHLLKDIDAESFEIISETSKGFFDKNNLHYVGQSRCVILHCKDKNGEFIVHNCGIEEIIVERITVLADYVASVKLILQDQEQKQKNRFYPVHKSGDEEAHYNQMDEWLGNNFDKKYNNQSYCVSFLVQMNNYFYSCFELYRKDHRKEYLEKGITLFEKIADTCFVNPYIYHNTACIYAALGNEEKALQCVSDAFYYGYLEIERIWKDEDLKLLFDNKDFKFLKQNYERYKDSYPFINHYLLEKIDGITENYYKNEVEYRILNLFKINDFEWFQSAISTANTLENKAYYKNLAERTALLINDVLQQQEINSYNKKTYEQYKEYKFLNARTHFRWLRYFFAEAHSEYPSNNISYCKPIAEKIKILLQQHKEDPDTKVLIQEIKEKEINKVFRLVE